MVLKILLGLLWLNFVFFWRRVNPQSTDAITSFTYLGGLVFVYAAVLAAWIYHNLFIWRKKGPRRKVRQVPELITQDSLQRDILRETDLEAGQEIQVTVVDGRKLFTDRAGTTPPPYLGEAPSGD